MDLYLLSLTRKGGHEKTALHVAEPPRWPARGRSSDRLALYLTLEGGAPAATVDQQQLMKRLSQTYFSKSGSVTAAMRAVAEELNDLLLKRNLRGINQGIGILTILTLRDGKLTIGLCGPVQAFLLSADEVQHYYDPQVSRRGLGLAKSTPIYYAQAVLGSADALVVSTQPPITWTTSSLAGLHGQGPENLRAQLLAQAGSDVVGLLAIARSGPGKIAVLKPKVAAATVQQPEDEPSIITAHVPQAPTRNLHPDESTQDELLAELIREIQEPDIAGRSVPVNPEVPSPPGQAIRFDGTAPDRESSADLLKEQLGVFQPTRQGISPVDLGEEKHDVRLERRSERHQRPERPPVVRRGAGKVLRAISATWSTAMDGLRALLRRMLPGEELFSLPTPVMAMVAVLIPLLVVTVATVVYFQRGVATQYQNAYSQALQAAATAQGAISPQEQRLGWDKTRQLLDNAEAYQSTSETRTLRQQVVQALDVLNLTVRLDYQPAIAGGLATSSEVTHMAATASDLYMLDKVRGSILRAFSTGRGYEMDGDFQCGPGLMGSQGIDPLVDMIVLGGTNPGISAGTPVVLGMDSNGNLLQCQAGAPPLFIQLEAPYTGWAQPTAFTQETGDLYILDPGKNAIWIFKGRAGEYSEQAIPFFTGNAPDLTKVTDIIVEKSDLYLLYIDGHTALCTYSGYTVSPTSCTDPLPYSDMRPGQEGQAIQPPPAYIQIEDTQAPEPALFALLAEEHALHYYSLRLVFQRQLSPMESTFGPAKATKPATAFTISPDKRLAFMALGNEIYYAGLP